MSLPKELPNSERMEITMMHFKDNFHQLGLEIMGMSKIMNGLPSTHESVSIIKQFLPITKAYAGCLEALTDGFKEYERLVPDESQKV